MLWDPANSRGLARTQVPPSPYDATKVHLGVKEKGGVEGAFTKCLLGARCAPEPVGLRLAPVSGPQTQGWACRALPSSGL